ncbi:MAG: xanthine dehydrogenase family protein molybdopterin-binding subunit, partial [Qingshengfaniella sp.]
GCRHMAVLRAPVAHARINALDTQAATRMEGVDLVLRAADLPATPPLPMIGAEEDQGPARQPVLARDRVLYAGQPVAAVVARTARIARAARDRIELRLTPLPVRLKAETARRAPPLHGDTASVFTLTQQAGDPDTAFAEAALVLDETFHFHRLSHNPMEPRGALCTGHRNGLRVAATSQVPGALCAAICGELGLPATHVTFEPLRLGGGFGCKEAVYPEEILTAVAAQRLACPVRWAETRAEHFQAAAHAREGQARVRMALRRDGTITALTVDGLSDIGAFFGFGGLLPGCAMVGMVRGPYRIPGFKGRTRAIPTNKSPLNVYRGAGHPQAVFAMERMMDKAARALGLDRIEIRRRNLIPADAFPCDRGTAYPGAGPIIYDSGNYPACLDQALEAIGAADFPARRASHEATHPHCRLGLGLGMMVELTATGPDETVELIADASGRVTLRTGCIEIGQRAGNLLTQILSDALDLPADRIRIDHGCPVTGQGGGTYASRGAPVIGAAALDAATALKRAAIARHAAAQGLAPDQIRWTDGATQGPEDTAPMDLGTLARLAGPDGLNVTGVFHVPQSSFASACHAAVVSVDLETGVTEVLDYAVVHDCGVALNPRGVEDQIIGGVLQGLGATLFEDLPFDDQGRPVPTGFLDCPLPVASNIPRFHLRHVETPCPFNPTGAKGAGEGGFTGTPATLVSAIDDALSAFDLRLTDDGPYTPSRVLDLIQSSPHLNS